jgi:hypothetical protein
MTGRAPLQTGKMMRFGALIARVFATAGMMNESVLPCTCAEGDAFEPFYLYPVILNQ